MKQGLRGLLAVLAACGLSGTLQAAESGTLLRPADLKAKPFLDADTLAQLPQHGTVDVLSRQGPWMQVRYKGKQGFVRMLQVRLDATDMVLAAAPGLSPSARGFGAPAGGVATATTGVRGFDEQALKNAQPAPEQFKLMISFAASPEQAEQFARDAQLTSHQVPYYDENGKPGKGGKK
jgi:hypothetical protein